MDILNPLKPKIIGLITFLKVNKKLKLYKRKNYINDFCFTWKGIEQFVKDFNTGRYLAIVLDESLDGNLIWFPIV